MRTLDELRAALTAQKTYLQQEYKVSEIGIFGSYVRGEQHAESDLDILIEFIPQSGMDLLKYVDLEDYLSNLLGVKVDLVRRSGLKKYIGQNILREVQFI